MLMSAEEYLPPPSGAPPLLTESQVATLCYNGWLKFELPAQLQCEIDQAQLIAADFFSQDQTKKQRYAAPKQPEEEGYYHVPGEKEYVTFRRQLSEHTPVEDCIRKIWPQIAALLHRMLCDLSRAGSLDPAAWDQVIHNTLTLPSRTTSLRDNPTLLRLFRYVPGTGVADRHTDLGLLTMCVGTGAGLEVLDYSTQPAADWTGSAQCTILIGETLQKLSSDNVRAGVHRVVANPVGRQSLVFALRPHLATTVSLEQFGGTGDVDLRALFASIKGSKYNVNATHDKRIRPVVDHATRVQTAQRG